MPDVQHPSSQPIEWLDGVLRLLDQTLLPHDVRYIVARDHRDVAAAIRTLAVRGAPLIGITAAYGLALAARRGEDLRAAARELAATRPTAVNLRWALERVLGAAESAADVSAATETEAVRIHDEQIAADARMGELGAGLLENGATVLTHCNTGTLATGGIGSALGVIKTAHRQGKRVRVLVCETRPLLQGARLTTWELAREGIAYALLVDGAAAGIIARGGVQAAIVGADRIAANGDLANKVGTYAHALAAAAHGVPFYVATPMSTVDAGTRSGSAIVIEDRAADEVRAFAGAPVSAPDTPALNPAFDVTPADLVTAIITERGVLLPPFASSIAAALAPVAAGTVA